MNEGVSDGREKNTRGEKNLFVGGGSEGLAVGRA